MSTLVVVIANVVAGAVVLCVTQAWAAAPSRYRAFRYFLAVLVSTTGLTLATLFLIGFRFNLDGPLCLESCCVCKGM